LRQGRRQVGALEEDTTLGIIRFIAAIGVVCGTALATASAASAHVTIPNPGEQGGFSIVTLSVPNERPDASTTSLRVQLPQDEALTFVSVQPKPGWTVETTMRTLDAPVEAFGKPVTEVVDTVTWSGGQIEPGQFDTFSLSVGVLPEGVDELAFPAIQTYSSGEEVAWIESTPASGEEPEHPAPVLALEAPAEGSESHGSSSATTMPASSESASSSTTSATSTESSNNGLAIAALVVAGVAVVLAGAALVTGRRSAA
jgi:uncharacterized protein YcnI